MNKEMKKFRAWLNHPEEMVTDFFVNGDHIVYDDGKSWEKRELDNDIIIMQFIGKKDRNGKEIYEGDIYKWDYEYDADYDGDMPIVRTSKGVDYVKGIFDTTRINMAASESKGVEVIGNIYETPELCGRKN